MSIRAGLRPMARSSGFLQFFRRSHTIIGSAAGAQTDYQVKVKPIYSGNVLEYMSYMGGYEGTNPIIPCGGGGTWNEKIREIGNILYEPEDTGKEYKAFFSAYSGVYGVTTKPVIGYAYSSDGISWTQVECTGVSSVGFGAEDPYILKVGETYYIYFELRDGTGVHKIARAYSVDCENWTYEQVVLVAGAAAWENGDVASPIVWVEDSTWYMLYEGRDNIMWDGQIGRAWSADGLMWTRDPGNPIFPLGAAGKFDDEQVVPNELITIDSTYYLFYAGYDGASWGEGIAKTDDFSAWTRLNNGNAILGVATAMASMPYYDGYEYIFHYTLGLPDTSGIYRGYPDNRESIVLNEECKTNFGDIRFAASDGTTKLDYWMKEYTDSQYAVFWVKVPNIPIAGTIIYIYYGNADEDSESNGADTFETFDDFEDGDVTDWTIESGGASGTWAASLTHSKRGNYSGKFYQNRGFGFGLVVIKNIVMSLGRCLTFDFRDDHTKVIGGLLSGLKNQVAPDNRWAQSGWFSGDSVNKYTVRWRDNFGWSNVVSTVTRTTDWHEMQVCVNQDGDIKFNVDGGADIGATNIIFAGAPPREIVIDGIDPGGVNPTFTNYFDDFRLRKYVDPEPTHGAWGVKRRTRWPF